ncbi:unnamed protein product [Camellia sinensis]
MEASGRSTVNLERSLDHDGDPLAITIADAVAASGVPPWNWRETPGNGICLIYFSLNLTFSGKVCLDIYFFLIIFTKVSSFFFFFSFFLLSFNLEK